MSLEINKTFIMAASNLVQKRLNCPAKRALLYIDWVISDDDYLDAEHLADAVMDYLSEEK